MSDPNVIFGEDWKGILRTWIPRSARPLIVVLGPTASGKTAFSLDVAAEVASLEKPVEILNSDSRQLYRFLDIGTAKIRSIEMKGIKHHLIDVLDPKEEATAAWYKEQATAIINDVQERGGIPILVGGSMLYASAIIDNLTFAPAVEKGLREQLERDYDKDGGISLHEKLCSLDPEAATGIHHRNKPYLVRALEICLSMGKKSSIMRQKNPSPYDLLIFGMHSARTELYARINQRTKELLGQGWIEEVRALMQKGYTEEDPGMESHGYMEIMSYLKTGAPSLEELPELIAARSRKYAKRQMTWWREDERIHWIQPS